MKKFIKKRNLSVIKEIVLFFYLFVYYSLGAQIRESSAPFISGDSFRSIAQYHLDELSNNFNPKLVKKADIIFVKTDYLKFFFTTMHALIENQYILITHNSDYSAPGEFESYLNDKKIIIWFGQNPSIKYHAKFLAIPIGIANQCWDHGNIMNFKKVLQAKIVEKKQLLGINFNIGTAINLRESVWNLFSGKNYCKNIGSKDHKTYLKNMLEMKFIISPAGNGLDTHRIWEALLVKTIPIVLSSPMDELLSDLPVLIINDWKDITEEFLINQYEEMQQKINNYNSEKIYFDYWKTLILIYQDMYK